MIPDKKTRDIWIATRLDEGKEVPLYALRFAEACDELESQRDELLAVCKDTERFLAKIGGDNPQPGSHHARILAAIAKCQPKGGDAP